VAAWKDSKTGRLRILINSRYRLIELDAATGTPGLAAYQGTIVVSCAGYV
jgi:hypothetical protein